MRRSGRRCSVNSCDWRRRHAAILAWSPEVVVGGWFGVGVARRFPTAAVRGFVIAAGAALTVYYFVTV